MLSIKTITFSSKRDPGSEQLASLVGQTQTTRALQHDQTILHPHADIDTKQNTHPLATNASTGPARRGIDKTMFHLFQRSPSLLPCLYLIQSLPQLFRSYDGLSKKGGKRRCRQRQRLMGMRACVRRANACSLVAAGLILLSMQSTVTVYRL